ncbi:MAG: universal stress protein [Desulfocapsaceae bacterium]|nr:universal stress protein [Desulfocapsaceae bacterium]
MEQRRIVAAVDGSNFSEKVMKKAIEYAKMLEAEIVLIYCHRKYPKILGQPHRDHIITAINDESADTVKPYLDMLSEAGVPYVERLLETPAGAAIAETAESEKCELIVMGSRGLSSLQGLIVGSTTNRVLHLAHCPVLVVK